MLQKCHIKSVTLKGAQVDLTQDLGTELVNRLVKQLKHLKYCCVSVYWQW